MSCTFSAVGRWPCGSAARIFSGHFLTSSVRSEGEADVGRPMERKDASHPHPLGCLQLASRQYAIIPEAHRLSELMLKVLLFAYHLKIWCGFADREEIFDRTSLQRNPPALDFRFFFFFFQHFRWLETIHCDGLIPLHSTLRGSCATAELAANSDHLNNAPPAASAYIENGVLLSQITTCNTSMRSPCFNNNNNLLAVSSFLFETFLFPCFYFFKFRKETGGSHTTGFFGGVILPLPPLSWTTHSR